MALMFGLTMVGVVLGLVLCTYPMKLMAEGRLPNYPVLHSRRWAMGEVVFSDYSTSDQMRLDCLLREEVQGPAAPYQPVQLLASAPGGFTGAVMAEIVHGWLADGHRVQVEVVSRPGRSPRLQLRKGDASALLDLEPSPDLGRRLGLVELSR